MATNNNNKIIVPEAKKALNQMKLEIANDFGFSNYDSIDKGNLSARENGSIGGEMTKRLVSLAQKQLR